MRELSQKIIKFDHEKNYKFEDFYVSKSNKHIFDLLNNWPKWEEMSDMELKMDGGYSALSQERIDKMVQKAGYEDEMAFYTAMNRMSEVVDDTLRAIADTYRAYNKKIKALPKPKSKPSPSYPRGKEAWDAVVYGGERGLDYGSDY